MSSSIQSSIWISPKSTLTDNQYVCTNGTIRTKCTQNGICQFPALQSQPFDLTLHQNRMFLTYGIKDVSDRRGSSKVEISSAVLGLLVLDSDKKSDVEKGVDFGSFNFRLMGPDEI